MTVATDDRSILTFILDVVHHLCLSLVQTIFTAIFNAGDLLLDAQFPVTGYLIVGVNLLTFFLFTTEPKHKQLILVSFVDFALQKCLLTALRRANEIFFKVTFNALGTEVSATRIFTLHSHARGWVVGEAFAEHACVIADVAIRSLNN